MGEHKNISHNDLLNLSEIYTQLNGLEECNTEEIISRLIKVKDMLSSDVQICGKLRKVGGVQTILKFLHSKDNKLVEISFFILAFVATNDQITQTELVKRDVFAVLSSSLADFEKFSFQVAPCIIYLVATVVSGSKIGQTLVRESMCQQHLVVIFHRLLQLMTHNSMEEEKELVVQTWKSLCIALQCCICNPQSMENQHQLGLILPKALAFLEEWISKGISNYYFGDCVECLINLITHVLNGNSSNQLNFSVYSGMAITLRAIISLENTPDFKRDKDDITAMLIHLLDASINDNNNNCALAIAMGAMPLLLKLLQQLQNKHKFIVLIVLAHLVDSNIKGQEEFSKHNGIAAIALTMASADTYPEIKQAANCLLEYCTQHFGCLTNKTPKHLTEEPLLNQSPVKKIQLDTYTGNQTTRKMKKHTISSRPTNKEFSNRKHCKLLITDKQRGENQMVLTKMMSDGDYWKKMFYSSSSTSQMDIKPEEIFCKKYSESVTSRRHTSSHERNSANNLHNKSSQDVGTFKKPSTPLKKVNRRRYSSCMGEKQEDGADVPTHKIYRSASISGITTINDSCSHRQSDQHNVTSKYKFGDKSYSQMSQHCHHSVDTLPTQDNYESLTSDQCNINHKIGNFKLVDLNKGENERYSIASNNNNSKYSKKSVPPSNRYYTQRIHSWVNDSCSCTDTTTRANKYNSCMKTEGNLTDRTHKKHFNKTNEYDLQITQESLHYFECDDAEYVECPSTIQCNSTSSNRKIIPFMKEEQDNLHEGVFTYGMNFKAILAAYKFHPRRTSTDLLLKWRSNN